MKSRSFTSTQLWLILGILLVAFNLRPAIMAVGPLVPLIREDTGISNSVAGMLTTIPLLSFAVFSLIAPRLGIRFGSHVAIFGALLTLFAGMLLRATAFVPTLLIGTILIGTGIAICNVLLPSIIKLSFPYKVGLMTSLYTAGMGLFASLASGVSVPLADNAGLGWSNALAIWGVLVLVALIIWFPQIRQKSNSEASPAPQKLTGAIWKEPVAWYVTLFMGFQSFLFYNTIAWLPDVLQSLGLSLVLAGWMLFLLQIISIPGNFAVPLIAAKSQDQKPIVVVICSFYIISLSGLIVLPNLPVIIISVLLMGFAQGMAFSLALTLLGLRASTPQDASRLSGMAQSLGYLVASIGPVFMGTLYDVFSTWQPFLYCLFIVTFFIFAFGWKASKNQYVFEKSFSSQSEAR
ncbi:CynX/NimT family MFS transporter [Salsuginibacillus kocurii]|uniref:CynX/NimT family MFS transporter n=1 Tax=Salsuginibacillus kocurii TaxID=427078 RepID=UPI000364BD30|nr:MFS transporter [Salsuginibacillus kocurii]